MSSEQEKPTVGIVFDSAMGNRIDEALALALLYGFVARREVRVISISLSKSSLKAAAFCDAVTRFYSQSAGGEHYRILPIGLSLNDKSSEDKPMITVPLSRQRNDGTPVYEYQIRKLNDTADPAVSIRNALSAQRDQNCVAVLTGPATNLARLLSLRGAKELILTKVQFLVFAGGAYPNGKVEANIKHDTSAARKLFAEWPTPIIASGYEIGKSLVLPASDIENGLSWAPDHPIVDAYRAFKPKPFDSPTWAASAALYAVRPKQGYFRLSEQGTIRVLEDGRTKFAPSPGGSHRYLIFDQTQRERIIRTYTEIVGAKPTAKEPKLTEKGPEQKKVQVADPPKQPQNKP